MAVIHEIVVDCARAPQLARFWAAVLDGYAVREYDAAEITRLAELGLTPETDLVVMLDGPGPVVCLQQVPEGKSVKNRLHLDLATPDRRAEQARLVALGGSVQQEYPDHTVLLDPEGNEFCVVDGR